EIDKDSVLLSIPIVNFFTGPYAASELQKIRGTVLAVLSENSVFNLDPVSTRLNDPTKLTLAGLAAGTPVYLAAVALESGRLRYIDGMGNFTERDGVTPVMSALMDSDVDAALDENLQPLAPARSKRIKDLSARYRAAIAAITADRATYNLGSTTPPQRLALLRTIGRNKERGDYLLDALHAQVRGIRLTTNVDPRRGVLASAAMPVFFDPIVIGAERYIDGGVREIIPMEIAVRNGVTDVVGICCSTRELPATDDMSNAGLAAVGLRSLTEIALNEVTFSDIEAVRDRGITCTVIAPTFNVHGATVVNPSLIEISADYGWMRACDEMQPALAAERNDFRKLSDLIATLRLRCYTLECYINENAWFLMAGDAKAPVVTLRTCRWIIRELLARRAAMGLPTHPQARRWWVGWARELRPVGPFGTGSVWSRLAAFSNNGVENLVAIEVANPDTFGLDAGSLVDGGNDLVWWIVRGAVFIASTETEQTTTRTPALVVPHAAVAWLPKIPRGSHLMAEQDTPTEVWIVRNEKRYRSTAGLIAASGLAGQTVAIVPPDGLNQIPDGGLPYWLGGLYISDNLRTPIDTWDPTPQVEGSSSTTSVGLTNRSARDVTVTALTITSSQDGGGSTAFTLTTPLPFTIPANTFVWVSVQFHPLHPGSITGMVSVTCDDPAVAQFSVPLSTSATPLGPHGLLQITPGGLDLGAIRVGQLVGQNLTLTNVGDRDLAIVDLRVADSVPPGQFAIPFSLPTQLAPGQSDTVYLSCSPTIRGRLTARLSADILSATNTTHPFQQHLDVSLAATAQAPVVFLAGQALGGRFPIRVRQLLRLDFGAAAPGTSVVRTFWIRNVGDLPLTVAGVDTTNQSAFGIPNAAIFPAVIAPGADLAVDANFLAPPVPGMPVSGELGIQSDDPLRPRAVLTVGGRASGPHLILQPRELLDLGNGSPPNGQLVIISDGTDPVTLIKIGVDDRDFAVGGLPAMPAALAPGTSVTLTVTYNGTVPGQHDARLAIAHDATASGQTLAFLKATI
ncbi:MAG TPA: choice-of-anchor D domain-containing protein, partial [Ilumatobacteraceae bacterium]|nr:choice-of-anchor D domain-containing protein [Ilumatobacteraceae bacterium]